MKCTNILSDFYLLINLSERLQEILELCIKILHTLKTFTYAHQIPIGRKPHDVFLSNNT